jgi:hypothetical protein
MRRSKSSTGACPLAISAALLTAALGAGCDQPLEADPGSVTPISAALTDSTLFISPGGLADGGDRYLAVWESFDGSGNVQITGQIFSRSTGLPLSPSRVYTSGSKEKYNLHTVFGGGKFLVTYTLQYAFGDEDAQGLFVRTDGTLESSFAIASSVSVEATDAVVWVPEQSLFFGTLSFSDHVNGTGQSLKGFYLSSTGALSMGTLLAHTMALSDIAYGDGRIALIWRTFGASAAADTLNRGYIVPGEMTIRSPLFMANSATGSVTFHPTRHKFGLVINDGTKLVANTWPATCTTASCAGPLRQIGSASSFGITSLGGVTEILPAGDRFLVMAKMIGFGTQGIATFSLDDTGFPLMTHVPALTPDCSPVQNSSDFRGGFSTGPSAVVLWDPGCANGPHAYAATFDLFGNRDNVKPVAD